MTYLDDIRGSALLVHKLVSVCVLWVLALPVFAVQGTAFPAHFDIRYTMNRQGLDIAEVHWRLEPLKAKRYRYTSLSKTIGIAKLFRDEQISEVSDWRFHQQGVQSLLYRYIRKGGKRQRQAEATFDWPLAQLHNNLNGKLSTAPLPAKTYDKLNYLIALMHDLGRNLRADHYRVADGAKLKIYDIRYLREERIETALGPLQTLVLERTVKGNKKITLVWAATSLHFLPVKIEHREDGETVHLTLTELKDFDGYRATINKAPKDSGLNYIDPIPKTE